MTAQIITEVESLLQQAFAKAKSVGHTIGDDIHNVLAKLRGDEQQLQTEAVADATQVEHDAETAMGPVLAEAEHDAAKVGSEAVADVEAAVQPPAAPPASA
jgi:hypothetical protein